MVVYEDLKPNKRVYRDFKVKSITGQNDYGSMQEVVFDEPEEIRIEEVVESFYHWTIDTGWKTGHVHAVKKILNCYPQLNIPICGLVKNDKHRLRALVYEDGRLTFLQLHQFIIC